MFAIRMPIDRISGYLQHRVGLGETGLAYVVGADGLLRSDLAQPGSPVGHGLAPHHIIAEWVPVNNDDTGGIVRGKTRWQGLSAADISPEQVLTVPMTSKNKKATRHDLTCCPLVSEILKVAPLPGVGPLIISEKTGLPHRENYYATDWREIAKLPAFRTTSGPWILGRGNLRGRGGDGRPRCGPEACWSLDAEDDTHLCPQRRPRQ